MIIPIADVGGSSVNISLIVGVDEVVPAGFSLFVDRISVIDTRDEVRDPSVHD